ncbi:ubl carboxyl-terminal hydrolase 18 [Rhinophrynus dorsalis]
MKDASLGRMHEDGYISYLPLLEEEETGQDSCVEQRPVQRLSYSTGKFKNGAIGLYNTGGTSCLNPLLQTLYMNPGFTDILCGIGKANDNVPPERRFPYELLTLFEEMQNSKEDAVPPYRILCCLQILDVRLFGQDDVADLLYSLWNVLFQQMPHPQLAERLRALYTIKLQQYVTCEKCSYQRSSNSDVLTVTLPVTHSRYHRNLPLGRALWRFFKPQEVRGGSKSFCPKCEEDTAGLKVMRLLSLPQTLTIYLKRISQRKSSQVQKINRTLSFPPTLDLSEVLDVDQLPEQELPQSQYIYQLFAVVAHSGTATFGHYCTYINSCKDQKWYCFNDSSVCKVSWDDVKCTYGNTSFHWGVTACLLVYIQTDKK